VVGIGAKGLVRRIYRWAAASGWSAAALSLGLSLIVGAAALFGGAWLVTALCAVLLFVSIVFTASLDRSIPLSEGDYPEVDVFFEQVPCYLSIQDRNFQIVKGNGLFRKDFGNRRGEKCYKVYKGADEICPNCPVVKTFADGKTHHSEETVITRAGERTQMIVYTTPIRDESGEIVGVMEMSTNITEIKRLQTELLAREREYRDLFDQVPCYISIQDRDFKIKKANRLFEHEFGDCRDRHCYEVYKGRTSICDNCPVEKSFEDGEIHCSEETLIGRDGVESQMIVYSSPIYEETGEILAVIEMATDITEVKELQRELTFMGRTIAVMAHRIKNILMGLEGGIFVVNTGMEEDDQEVISKGWVMIERNVAKISRIVRDLLYCSKDREMIRESIDPAIIVGSVYDLFSGRALKDGLDLKLEMAESMPVGDFDQDALHSMITNLVTNAFDACLTDPTEGKEQHWIIIRSWWGDDEKYHFEVEDNGPGIPGSDGECVFEEFFSTKGREGTGLGLLVAHKVVEEHGGTITYISAEGEGTTFRAVIPGKVTEKISA
jgi:PAS domain S-box-containing protein